MPMDRDFLIEMEAYYEQSEPEFTLVSQKLGALPESARSKHDGIVKPLAVARKRFLNKLEYLRRYERLQSRLTQATRHELMRSWFEYRARLSALESTLSKAP